MKQLLKNKVFLFSFSIVFFAIGYFLHHPIKTDSAAIVQHVEQVLRQKEKRLTDKMIALALQAESKSYNQLFAQSPNYYSSLMKNEGLALLIYENDTLKFWSDNSIAVENWMKEVCLDTKMVKLHNGWFEVMKPHTNATTTKSIVGLILIKNEYPYQNNYLINEFQHDFSLPAQTKLIVDNSSGINLVNNRSNEFLFSLNFNTADGFISWANYWAFVLVLISFACFVLFLQNCALSLFPLFGKNNPVLFFIVSVIALRYISIKTSFPSVFYSLDLFSPKIYADANSIWLTSLGDLLINVCLLFYLSYFVIKHIELGVLSTLGSKFKVGFSFLAFLVFFWFSWIITDLFIGLIKNSNISFSINNLFSLTTYSFIALFIIGSLLFVFFLLCDKMLAILKLFQLSKKHYVFLFFISATIHAGITHLLGTLDLVIVFWPLAIMLTIAIIKRKSGMYSFSGVVFLVFIFSVFSVHLFTKHTRLKENEARKIYAERLAAEQDPIAELLFQEIKNRILSDTILFSYINRYEKQPAEFEKYLKQEYFSGFWGKYDVRIALFDSMCSPLIISQNTIFDNNLYFDELIKNKGGQTSCTNFSFINNSSGKISYIGKLHLSKSSFTKINLGTLYIELDAKFVSDEIGFPELLLDKNVGLAQELSNYSYAKYKSGQLISHYGKFPYSLTGKEFSWHGATFLFYNSDAHNHLVYRPDANSLIIISKFSEGIIGNITTFSYLFAYFSLLLLIILFFKQVSKGALFERFSFKNRIQILLVLIVLASLALFGGGTIFYIKKQFETKNKETISEKIHSIQIDLEEKLSEESDLKQSLSSYTTFVLKKLSSIFFTDINIYDIQGNLFASSRPKIFDEGLTSKKMNPEAYKQIAVFGKTEFIHDERIGRLEYLSVYIPFKNKKGELLAYLNLPYFAKQSELEKEISGFLVALINIYVLLFALSIVSAIFISNYVTKPLKLIQDKLSKIKLGKTNELIEWHEKDEIGSLVSEYNRMIVELSKSAELLGKSERESAWREMAKQVAHEIKNPLTPMKLSIQHLQRTWNDNAPDMDQKIGRITKTIIEQIDTLSSIATEFSNFAKMPKANLEKIDLVQIIKNSIHLFNENETTEIVFNDSDSPTFVLADKEQLLRVFNNLFKNAIQSIPENRKGKVDVKLSKEKDNYLIMISDNGSGINKNIIDRIFIPNFTTKTRGMGLGLAMVKSIVEISGGKIWFETEPNKGTTFFVEWPCFKENTN